MICGNKLENVTAEVLVTLFAIGGGNLNLLETINRTK